MNRQRKCYVVVNTENKATAAPIKVFLSQFRASQHASDLSFRTKERHEVVTVPISGLPTKVVSTI